MRQFLLVVSVLGTLVFGAAALASLFHPLWVERLAREVVRMEVERRVGERVDSLTNSRIGELAQRALDKVEADRDASLRAIRADIPAQVAQVLADMLRVDCECRQRMARALEQGQTERLASLTQLRDRLASLIETTYVSVAQSLIREFRIFTASNAFAFVLLGLVTLRRKAAGLQLALPAAVLLGAVVITGGFYLFGQNWLHTIVFANYTGFAYTAYLAAVAAMLADVAFNRARVTTTIVNTALQAVGSAAKAVPC